MKVLKIARGVDRGGRAAGSLNPLPLCQSSPEIHCGGRGRSRLRIAAYRNERVIVADILIPNTRGP